MRRVFFSILDESTRDVMEICVVRPMQVVHAEVVRSSLTLRIDQHGGQIEISLDRREVFHDHENMPRKFSDLAQQMIGDIVREGGDDATWFYDHALALDPSLRSWAGVAATGWKRAPSFEDELERGRGGRS